MEISTLYNELYRRVSGSGDKVLTPEICSKIKRLPSEYGGGLLGLIYRHYQLNHTKKRLDESDYISSASKKDQTLNLPYKGKTYSNGMVPQYQSGDKLPPVLVSIIVEYINFIEDK